MIEFKTRNMDVTLKQQVGNDEKILLSFNHCTVETLPTSSSFELIYKKSN